MSSFELPSINTNTSGWGPQPKSNIDKSLHILLPPALNHNVTSSNIVTSLKTLISDWTAPASTTTTSHHRSSDAHAEKADSFTVVAHQTSSGGAASTSASAALGKRKNAWAVQREHAQSQQKTYTMEQQKQIHRTLKKSGGGGAGAGAGAKNRFSYGTRQQKEAHQAQLYRTITTSIAVKPDWEKVAAFAFKDLNSMILSEDALPQVEDVKMCGDLEAYDKKFDRVNTKTPVALKSTSRVFIDSTTTEDPVLNNMSVGGSSNAITLFATDQLLALLIAASRTVYPWDLVFRKVGNNIYLDKRPGIPMIELLTVNENSVRDAPSIEDREKKNFNSANIVTQESSNANQNFSQFVLNQKSRTNLSEPSPFHDESIADVAPVGYRYRKWKFNDNLYLVARCEIDAVVDPQLPERKYVSVKTLTEYHGAATPTNWRTRLDTQRSAVLLTEYKNNAAKMTRFTAQAILSGVDQMKVGFLSRAGPTTIKQHHILGVETYIPSALARTVKLSTHNMWGVIQGVVGVVAKQEGDGVFVLLHPPNKQQLDLYKINNEDDLVEPSDNAVDEEDINDEE